MGASSILSWAGLQIVLLLASLTMVFFAIRGRRVGSTRYCRRCRYNLTGQVGCVCTECGAAIDSPRAVLVGEKRVRRGMLVVGILLTIGGAVPLVLMGAGIISNFNYLTIMPTSWVMADLQSGRPPQVLPALVELTRRARVGSLTTDEEATVADFCLKQQTAKVMMPGLGGVTADTLELLRTAGRLSADRTAAFLSSVQWLTVDARPIVAPGAPIPVRAGGVGRGPVGGITSNAVFSRVLLDGTPVRDQQGGSFNVSGTGSSAFSTFRLPPQEPGEHTVTVVFDLQAFSSTPGTLVTSSASGGPPPPAASLHRSQHALTATFRVAADPAEAAVLRRKAPDLEAEIRSRIVSMDFNARRREGGTSGNKSSQEFDIQGYVEFLGVRRVGLAFEVSLESEGRRIADLGTVAEAPGGAPGHRSRSGVGTIVKGPLPQRVDVVLRPSITAAAESIDIREIWDGELRFPNVELRRLDVEEDSGDEEATPAASAPASRP